MNAIGTQELKGYTLKGLSNVELLSFAHSNIEKLEPYSFFGVDNITTITFHSAKLRTVTPNAFVGIGKVTNIKLKATDISTLRCGALEGLNCVRYIHWDDSPIRCDCNIQWMVEMKDEISQDLTKSLVCASPFAFAGKSPFELMKNDLRCNDEERYAISHCVMT